MSIRQASKTLLSRQNPFADSIIQLEVLNSQVDNSERRISFAAALGHAGHAPLRPKQLDILQINMGKLCNQSCAHCHVDAGPDRTEVMSKETMEECLDVIHKHRIPTIDITGGAPELNPHFRWFVEQCRLAGAHVMDRCNLTIIVSNPKHASLPSFFSRHKVELMCSLPHFNSIRTDQQRGSGVFEDSIKALQWLNKAGYGMPGSGLILNLIHNPSGAFLPGNQLALETEYKLRLRKNYGIEFNRLFVITNLPVSRFLEYLITSGNYAEYMETLVNAFNPATIDHLMCRNTLSVSWDGYLYDCDFNQMLDLRVASPTNHISAFNPTALMDRDIVTNQHCFGCTAGSGSSCTGNLI